MYKKVGLAFATLTICVAPAANAESLQTGADPFDSMSALVGTWKRQDTDGSKFRIIFELTANDSVLIERWIAGNKTHSLTLYHRDVGHLVATHYCPQGNQPRMKVVASDDPSKIVFDFWDATNLKSLDDNHQHQLSFDLSDPQRIKRGEIYLSGKGEQPSELVLERMN